MAQPVGGPVRAALNAAPASPVNLPQTGGAQAAKSSASKTVTDTIIGEHEHTIVGYSLVKGIGDGEPIASERFTVGGHEWVLLFYPDGKRSSTTEGPLVGGGGPPAGAVLPQLPGPGMPPAAANNPGPAGGGGPVGGAGPPAGHGAYLAARALELGGQRAAQPVPQAPGGAPPPQGQAPPPPPPANPQAALAVINLGPLPIPPPPAPPVPQGPGQPQLAVQGQQQQQQQIAQQQPVDAAAAARRQETNEYAALFVALIGETDQPLGVVNTSDGRVVRAFHRFTLVDQLKQARDLTKGRRRDQGAVKISCARQDPNARNCHGYRKFVKRSLLENPNNGYLVNDTIIIKYTIELVVSSGGALAKVSGGQPKVPPIHVPPPQLGADLAGLLESREGADVRFLVDGEELAAHRIVLAARSPVFAALLNGEMREGQEGMVTVEDVRAPVFRALLHFVYADVLPEELDGQNLEVSMAQHLLAAADRFQLSRLRRICERRLCETVEVESVATTLALAEQNNAVELKRVCLEFVSRNLQAVMVSEGYQHMVSSCPQLQAELLHVIAVAANERGARTSTRHAREAEPNIDDVRRVRARRE